METGVSGQRHTAQEWSQWRKSDLSQLGLCTVMSCIHIFVNECTIFIFVYTICVLRFLVFIRKAYGWAKSSEVSKLPLPHRDLWSPEKEHGEVLGQTDTQKQHFYIHKT